MSVIGGRAVGDTLWLGFVQGFEDEWGCEHCL